jgi:predicted GIY-YIG superfamily endonuclease
MGNRLSGILAELFMQKVQAEVFSLFTPPPPTFRYVDDLLIFTKDETEAKRIFSSFNNNTHNLRFTLELPENESIPFLDFRVLVSLEGAVSFDFYRKPMRNDNFVNAASALPKQMIGNIICNENHRIKSRCSDSLKSNLHIKNFSVRLRRNGHKTDFLKKVLGHQIRRVQNKSEQKFFLNIPFVNDTFEHKIKNSLQGLGVRILIAHKSKKLKHVLSSDNHETSKCNLPNCHMNNNLCMAKGVVYLINCACGASYIGSTFRFLHLRFKEHLAHRTSPIYVHNTMCSGPQTVQVLSYDKNVQRLRIKEALFIKERKPSLNAKEDLLRTHLLF